MQILVAPNAFKNSLTATAAAAAIQAGLQASNLNCRTVCFPVGDGGDGTGELLINHFNGLKVAVDVLDPLGRKITAAYGLIDDGKTAVIEMADASGLRLLQHSERNPLLASSFGAGQLINAALDAGVNKIIIGLGGSATVDGGCGLLAALGIRFLDVNGQTLAAQPLALRRLHSIDTSALHARVKQCQFLVLCDVKNYLLGKGGAANVFGPQKGATPQQVDELEAFLTIFNKATLRATGKDVSTVTHGGAAGGCAAGMQAFLNAELVDGAGYFLKLTDFESALAQSQVVITGEGSLDEQTLQGKAPFAVAQKAKFAGLPVIGLAGSVPLQPDDELANYFDALLAIGNQPDNIESALTKTADNLKRTATALGNLLAINNKKIS